MISQFIKVLYFVVLDMITFLAFIFYLAIIFCKIDVQLMTPPLSENI